MNPSATPSSERRAPPTVHVPYQPVQRAHVASVDHRLADRWHCAIGTAKARRERAFADSLTVIEECLASGDTERLRHYLNRVDAACAGMPAGRTNPLIASDKADTQEDVLEVAYNENPCRETARAWFDGLALEGRTNEPAMADLRSRWNL